MSASKLKTPAVLQASKDRRLARLGVVITTRPGMATYDYPVPS